VLTFFRCVLRIGARLRDEYPFQINPDREKEDVMQQAKFSCRENQLEFLSSYKDYGFKDKSALVRESLDLLREKLEAQKLRESADLYAEVYRDDSELKILTDSAAQGWPE
jgi:hypothetical protein